MTIDEAYRIMGVDTGCSLSEIGMAYRNKLQHLQSQFSSGQSPIIRQRIRQQVLELTAAWEMLQKKAAEPAKNHQQVNTAPLLHAEPAPVYTCPSPVKGSGALKDFFIDPTLPIPAVVIGFAVVALTMLLIACLCLSTSTKVNKTGSAQLRVLAVPWCQVEIDGEPLGTSGQVNPFELAEGTHELTVWRDDKFMSKNIKLRKDCVAIARVWFEKDEIRVSYEK